VAGVRQLPVLTDNYVYLIDAGDTVAIVDPAVDTIEVPAGKQVEILNTHHHGDHVGGNLVLKQRHRARITGPRADAARIPGIDTAVGEGDAVRVGNLTGHVFDVPGHTRGHIAYHFPEIRALFCGDTLFSLGCGRLVEGTPEQMFTSLAKLKALPPDTLVYCAHEYTESNFRFAQTVEPDNAALRQRGAEVRALRAKSLPTVPSTLAQELAANPFLRARDAAELGRIRKLKDAF
jgi:hydroxyacylglutathione hydrolase